MKLLVNSCKTATELIDKQQLTPLSSKEKIQLQAHKAMCKTCNAYGNQSKFIDKLINRWFKTDSFTSQKLSPQKKIEIIKLVNDN